MRSRRFLPGLIAVVSWAGQPVARADTTAGSEAAATAVLGLETFDVSPGIADAISEQLRGKVASARDMRLVAGKDLVELKLVFGCADEGAACLAQAGKSLDAHQLIYGSVRRVGDDYTVWLKLFDVRRQKVATWLTETISRKQTDAPGIEAASARWFAKLTGRPVNVGTVQLTTSEKGAVVKLDGMRVGSTADRPLVISEVAVGIHELALEKPGHPRVVQQFAIAAGQTVPINLALEAGSDEQVEGPQVAVPVGSPDAVPRGADVVDGHAKLRVGFWVTLAAGLLSTAGAIKFGLDVRDVNRQLDPFRRFKCASSPTGLCDSKGMPASELSQDNRNFVAGKTDAGNRDQTLQWICIGVGSALGIASGYLLYRGYLDPEEDQAHTEARQGLRIFPAAGASSGAIVAEFDF